MDISYDVITFTSKYFYLKKALEPVFADVIKSVTFFVKKIFKDSRKIKRIRNFVSECNLYMYFLI